LIAREAEFAPEKPGLALPGEKTQAGTEAMTLIPTCWRLHFFWNAGIMERFEIALPIPKGVLSVSPQHMKLICAVFFVFNLVFLGLEVAKVTSRGYQILDLVLMGSLTLTALLFLAGFLMIGRGR